MPLILSKLRGLLGFNPISWWRASRRVLDQVAEFDSGKPTESSGPNVLVVVGPWQGTFVPWFTLAMGHMLARNGAQTRFVFDDLAFGSDPIRQGWVLASLRRVMGQVAKRYPVISLSEIDPSPLEEGDEEEIARLAALNATWSKRGEMVQDGRQELIDLAIRQTTPALGKIRRVIADDENSQVLFIPGGVFQDSGLWVREAKAAGMRVASFDAGGYEATLIASDGLACQLRDIPRAFEVLQSRFPLAEDERELIFGMAEAEIAKRRLGNDKFKSQLQSSGAGSEEMEGGILVALNSSWDAAALGLHRAYPTNTDWLVGTVRHLLATTERPIIVRQHPVERLPIFASSDDYGSLLAAEFPNEEKLHFISASEPINSYALLDSIVAVVAHSSTFAMESVVHGVPVVTGSASYYSELGFVEYSGDRETYHRLLEKAGRGELEVAAEQREDAKLCYYITQCCNWVFCDFNPANYPGWIEHPLDHWYRQPEVSRMVHAINTGVPIAVLNHDERLRQQRMGLAA